MKQYLSRFLRDFEYTEEAAAALMTDYGRIMGNDGARGIFDEILTTYRENCACDYSKLLAKCDEAAEACGVHFYTVRLLAFICMSEHLRALYEEKGIDLAIWRNSMLDLRYKTTECKLVKGIYGSFVAAWFPRFFNLTRFALGRLQFEVVPFKRSYERDGKILTPTSPVINVHIPRTETPLDRESCLASYAQAKEFFKDQFAATPMAFVCGSWLLFEKLREFLPENANIIRFMNDYDVIETTYAEEGDYTSLWRIFDMECSDLDALPEDSTLRRAYKAYAKSGARLGSGFGVFFAE